MSVNFTNSKVTVVSSALPTGAATAALQTTGNTSLSSIDSKITACNTGAVVVSSGTITANIGTSGSLALDATLTNGNQKTKLLDTGGTNVASISSGGALKVDNSAVTQPISAASLPLPTGASTSALQTTGNTSLSSIDGKITACNTGAVVISSSALPSGAATAANQSTEITSLQLIDDLVKNEDAAVSSGDAGIGILARRVNGNSVSQVNANGDYELLQSNDYGSLKVTAMGSLIGLPNYFYNAFGVYEIPATFMIDPASLVIPSASNAALQVTGDEAHDAVDDGNPNKIGGKAASYAPATSDQPSANKTAVAANDRVNGAFNLFGEFVEGVNPYFFTLDNISTTYNNTTTTATSTAKNCWNYRQASLSYELTKANSPTDILFEVEVSLDGTNYAVMQNDFLGDLRESVASVGSGIKKTVTFTIAAQKIRVKTTATGTTATATFTIANAVLYLRN